jgi:hypothetical protein
MGEYWKVSKFENHKEITSTILDLNDMVRIEQLLQQKIEEMGEYYGAEYEDLLQRLREVWG